MSEAVNIPQLRFPEFREEWKIVKLTDIVDVMTDYVAAGSFESLRNNVTVYDKPNYAIYLRLTDLRKGIYHKDLKYVDRSSYDFLNKSNLCGGEILMANIGANVGDTYLMPVIDDFATIAPNMIVIKENRLEFLSAFLFYWLNTRKGEKSINTAISGSGQPKINKTDLKQIKISLTSQLEQAKIASFLTAVDNKIEQLSKKQELLGEYKKGLMQQIFSQAIRFKANDGSDFPDWEEKKLGDLSVVISDGNYGELYPTSSDFKLTGVPFLRANNIKSLKIDGTDTKYITEEQHSLLTSGHLQTNDILITTRGVLGNLAIVESTHNGSNINAQICLLRVTNTSELNHFYLLFVLDHRDSKKQYKAFETGTALKQLPKGNLRKIKLKLPTLFEQNKIANFLSSIDTKIEQVDKQLDESKQFKKALLQQMFV